MSKRIFVLLLFMMMPLFLMACGEETTDDITLPSFNEMVVNERNPVDADGNFETYMAEKEEILMLEISLNNPSNLTINSIKINGTTYRQSRFEADSTPQEIRFGFDVLRIPGERLYTLESIEYMHPEEGVKELEIEQDNQFEAYVLESQPTVELNSYTPNQASIDVDLMIRDNDDVLQIATLMLIKDDTVVETVTLDTGRTTYRFTDLLSNANYALTITASYERADGNLVSEDVLLFEQLNIMTLSKVEPQIEIALTETTQDSISFDVAVDDPDETGHFHRFELYLEDDLIDSISGSAAFVFTDLLSDNVFELRGRYQYDLNDGEGIQDKVVTLSAITLAKASPIISAEKEEVSHNSVSFSLFLEDIDETLTSDELTLALMHGDDIYKTKQTTLGAIDLVVFDEILSDNTFTLHIYGNYDLNDGQGEQSDQLLGTFTFDTLALELPDISVTTQTQTHNHFVWRIDVTAIEAFIIEDSLDITVYDEDGNRLKKTTMQKNIITFELRNLLANQTVYVEIDGDYDLDDGAGKQTGIIYANSYTTLANSTPTGSIDSVTLNTDIEFEVSISDSDETKVPGSLRAELYEDDGDGNITLVQEMIIDEGENTFSHTPLDEYTYIIEIYVDYDLRDGKGVHHDLHLSTYQIANIDEIDDQNDNDSNDD